MGMEGITNKNIFTGDLGNKQKSTGICDEKKQVRNGTVYIGDVKEKNDSVLNKKIQAQRESIRKVLKQFNNDNLIEAEKQEYRDYKTEMEKVIQDAQTGIDRINELQEKLTEKYGISDDSEEKKNLDLLRKSLEPDKKLTEEEIDQLRNMGELTEYQKTSLTYDAAKKVFERTVEHAQNESFNAGRTVEEIEIQVLKTHYMVDAQKIADLIMRAASEEVMKMLLEETKENIDENLEKNEEKAEKLQEEAEAKKQTEDSSGNAEVNKEILKQVYSENELDNELKKIVEASNILKEDLKGIEVNELM